jgi:undecaprenyl-diphosphatase
MGIIHAVILGIIEGLTEFIPVSSTAHLLITGKLFGLSESSLLEVFSISIQSGAILAAVWLFWEMVWKNLSLIPKIIVAFLPTALVGLTLYPLIQPLLENTTVMAIALITGGIVFLFLKPIEERIETESISYRQAIFIGIAQTLSFIPGVSRAGATLIGGTLLKIPRKLIVPFSFLLGIPTILGASLVGLRSAPKFVSGEWVLIAIGAAVSFVVALFTIKFFIRLLTEKPLSWFGWYRIAIGVLVLLFV